MKFEKRGISAFDTIVVLIIGLLSFAVLFLFIQKYGEAFSGVLPKEACRDSAVLRAGIISSTKGGLKAVFNLPDLKCKTEYKCLSSGGECAKGYSSTKVSEDADIKKEIANSMAECWDTLGKGKLDFVGPTITSIDSTCIVCTVISFDKNLKAESRMVPGLPDYMSDNNVPGEKISYLKYLSTPNAEVIGTDQKIDTSKDYAVIYAVYNNEYLSKLLGAGAGAGAGAYFFYGLGTLINPAAGVGLAIIGGAAGGTGGFWGTDKAKGELAKIFAKDKGQVSYAVHFVPYDAKAISGACKVIESLP